MKKLALLVAAAASVGALTPANAQYYAPSANDARHYDECHDPGYLSATHGRGCEDFGYNGGNYNAGYNRGNGSATVVVQQHPQEGTCVFILICTSHGRRPHAGDTCTAPDGTKWGLDKNLRWYVLPNSAPMRNSPRNVTALCGDSDLYHAEN